MSHVSKRRCLARCTALAGALSENPHRVGGPLRRELADLHAARRGTYRIIYQIIDDRHLVVVHRIDHRANVYRPR